MIKSCPNVSYRCLPCNEPPVVNLSAEAPDFPTYLGISSMTQSPDIQQDTPLGYLYETQGCIFWCWSTISQQEADDCATQQAALCKITPTINPVNGDGYEQSGIYYSAEQLCVGTCENGGSFTFILPAGFVKTLVPNLCNEIAHAICLKRANLTAKFCLTTYPEGCCVGTDFTSILGVTGGVAPYNFTIISGSLPPGLALTTDGTIYGVPTAGGSYTCTIRIRDSSGGICFHDYSLALRAIEFLNDTILTPAESGVVYSETLTQNGGIAPLSWVVTSGTLPPGLTLNEGTGLISGTPTTNGTYLFTVTLQDEAT